MEHLVSTPGATLVHCSAGKDRTGLVVCLLLLAAGVSRADVVADYAATDLRVDLVVERLARRPSLREAWRLGERQASEALMRTRATTIELFVTGLEARHGTIGAWWLDAGATEDQLAIWRRRLVERADRTS